MLERICYRFIIVILLIFNILGCSEKVELASLRSDEEDYFFLENNKLAISRFSECMYSKNDIEKKERFKMVHISDPHLSSWSDNNNHHNPLNLRQSIRFANQPQLKMNAIVATGDYISNTTKKEATDYLQSFVNFFNVDNRLPSFLCNGNHDCNVVNNNPTDLITQNELNKFLKYNSLGDNDKNYYYSDVPNPQGGYIRIIALDMLDQATWEYNTMFFAYYSQQQIDWLGNVALKKDLTPAHSIVILTHYPFQPYSRGGKHTYLCDGDYVHPWNMIPEIVEAFRAKSTIKKGYQNKLTKEEDLYIDFDFKDVGGEFIAYLGGHAHCFATFEIEQLENRNNSYRPQKMILCTNQAPSEVGTFYNKVIRIKNSLSSNSFNIYAFDTIEKKIYITFFGAFQPIDSSDHSELITLSY